MSRTMELCVLTDTQLTPIPFSLRESIGFLVRDSIIDGSIV